MAKRIVKKDVIKKKKKKWFEIVSPKDFGSVILGESLVEKPEDLIGRTVRLDMAKVLKGGRRSNYEFIFEVVKIDENKAICDVKSFGLVNSFVKRSGRKAKIKIEDSFLVETKNGVKVRVKPLILTRFNVASGVERALRMKMKEFLIEIINGESYTVLINKLASSEIQKKMKRVLGKVYPLSISEIRVFQRVK